MERLVVAAIEEQVADGSPRDVLDAKEPFRLVSEYFIGKVRFLWCMKRIPEAIIRLASFRPDIAVQPYNIQASVRRTSFVLSWFMCLKEAQYQTLIAFRCDGLRFPSNATDGPPARV